MSETTGGGTDVAAQGVRDADVPGPVLFEAPGLGAVDLARYPPDGRLCLPLLGRRELEALGDIAHGEKDIGASIASGSFKTDGMIIAPCSMRTLAAIATGVTDNLVARAADVVLKERRRLVLLARETPLTLVHLRNMVTVTEMGGVVFPPVPAFYAKLDSLDAMIDQTVGRVLDLFGIDSPLVRRWSGVTAPADD